MGASETSQVPLRFFAVSDLTLDPDAKPSLVGGVVPANPKDWSSIYYSTLGADYCTATLVGERVLLTAAHCVRNGPKIVIGEGNAANSGDCTASPYFDGDTTADWALCQMQVSIPAASPEKINPDLAAVSDQSDITLTGFGCMAANGPGSSGTFSLGAATIVSVPNGTNYIATYGAVAACYGDSGGPAFVGSNINHRATRALVSINSRGDAAHRTLLSSVGTHDAICFFQSWATSHHTKINGQAPTLKDCPS